MIDWFVQSAWPINGKFPVLGKVKAATITMALGFARKKFGHHVAVFHPTIPCADTYRPPEAGEP